MELLHEVRITYADATGTDAQRRLDWCSWPVPYDDEARAALRLIGRYNDFDPARVIEDLDAIARDIGISVAIAREGSPAVYLVLPYVTRGDLNSYPPHKEVLVRGEWGDTVFRRSSWQSRPDEIGVNDGRGIYGDTPASLLRAPSGTVLRLWWD